MKILNCLLLACFYLSKSLGQLSTSRQCTPNPNPLNAPSQCCGLYSTMSSAYVSGPPAAVREYPWLTLLEYWFPRQQAYHTLCGGSLISSRFVITAAHCYDHSSPVSVRLGEYNTTHRGPDCVRNRNGIDCTQPIRIQIASNHIHPRYSKINHIHDIALIKLAADAPYTDYIRPICIPPNDFTAYAQLGNRLYVVGFGLFHQRVDDRGAEIRYPSDVKRHLALPYIPNWQCQNIYPPISSTQVCAGWFAGENTCFGDSGGPLMIQNGDHLELVGVVSFGRGQTCNEGGVPTVFTKVWDYRNWIMDLIRRS